MLMLFARAADPKLASQESRSPRAADTTESPAQTVKPALGKAGTRKELLETLQLYNTSCLAKRGQVQEPLEFEREYRKEMRRRAKVVQT